jgi:hypothetical protein
MGTDIALPVDSPTEIHRVYRARLAGSKTERI